MSESDNLESRVLVELSFPSKDLARLKSLSEELGLTEGEVIKTALNYLGETCDIRKKGEHFVAKIGVDSDEAPYVRAFEPRPVTIKYGAVQVPVIV